MKTILPRPVVNYKLADTVLFLLETNLHFRVSLPLPEAKEVLRNLPKYNEIPHNLHEIIEGIKQTVGSVDFGPKNPNTGGFDNVRIEIGNERSLVVYVDAVTAYRPNDEHAVTVSNLESLGIKFKADEINVEHTLGSVKARFWWD